MAAITLVVTIAGFTGVTWQWREAEKARTTAQVKADDEARARSWAEREKKRADDQRDIAEARSRELAAQKERIREELHRSNMLFGRLLRQGGKVTEAERVWLRAYLTRPSVESPTPPSS